MGTALAEAQVILAAWSKFGNTSSDEDMVEYIHNRLVYYNNIVKLTKRAQLARYLQKKLFFKHFNGWKKMLDTCAKDYLKENWEPKITDDQEFNDSK